MSRLNELADLCEKATGPDERLNAEIVAALHDALLKPYPPQTDFGPSQRWQFWSLDGKHFLGNEAKPPFKVLPFTASLDAAMSLVTEGQESGILHEAWSKLSAAHALHVRFWKTETDGYYAQALARFVAAAALRASASQQNGGEG